MKARAICHPSRAAKGRGLCGSCYNKKRFLEDPAKRERAKSVIRACHRKNGPIYRARRLEKRLGLSPAKHAKILKTQKGVCAICKLPPKKSRWGILHVDHDHVTNRVRGLICSQCNTALGLFNDSIERLRSAQKYLMSFSGK